MIATINRAKAICFSSLSYKIINIDVKINPNDKIIGLIKSLISFEINSS
jgi:hypothetical protein